MKSLRVISCLAMSTALMSPALTLSVMAQNSVTCPAGTVANTNGKCTFGNKLPGTKIITQTPLQTFEDREKERVDYLVTAPGTTSETKIAEHRPVQRRVSNYVTSRPLRKTGDVSVGAVAGTAGFGPEITVTTSKNMVLRGSYTALDWGQDKIIDGVSYDADLDLSNGGMFVDYYPFEGSGFNISGGAYIGQKVVNIDATPLEDVEIGNEMYTPEEVGSLSGEVEWDNFAPYVGVGYDHMFEGPEVSVNVRAGIMYIGDADVTLTSTDGTLSEDPTFQSELNTEIDKITKDAEDYKIYPVISVGAAKRF